MRSYRLSIALVGAASLFGAGAFPARAGDVEIHYAPDENLERIDVDLIRSVFRRAILTP